MFDKSLYFRNIVVNSANFGVSVLVSFALTPFIVHSLGDRNYGYWSVITSLLTYLSFFDLGFQSALGHYVSRHLSEDDSKALEPKVNSALTFFLLVCGICVLSGAIVAALLPTWLHLPPGMARSLRYGFFFAAAAMGLRFAASSFTQILVGLQRFDLFSGTLLASRLFNTVLVVAALCLRPGLASLGLAALISAAAEGYCMFRLARKRLIGIRLRPFYFNRPAFLEMWHYGGYNFLINITSQVSQRAAPFIIGWKIAAVAVTYYGIGADLIPFMLGVTSAVSQPLLQIIIPMDVKKDLQSIRIMTLTGTRYLSALVTLLSVNLLLVGPRFLGQWMGAKYLFGHPYGSSGLVLQILAVSLLISQTASVAHQVLFARRLNSLFAMLTLGDTVLFLILAFALVKPFGILGVAVAAMIPRSINEGVFVPLLTTRQIGMSLLSYLRHAIAPNALALAATLVVGYYLLGFWKIRGWVGVFGAFTWVSLLHLAFLAMLVVERHQFKAVLVWFREGKPWRRNISPAT